MQISAEHLANLLGGSVEGDPTVVVNRPSKIEEGGPGSISFLGNMKYESYAYTTTASILLVTNSFQPKEAISATLIRVPDVYAAIALLLEKFSASTDQPTGVAANAFVHETSSIGPNGSVGMFAVIMEQSKIGKNCQIHPHVYIGKQVQIGDGVRLYPGVRIMDGCILGNEVTIHPNTVIGSDGFGFAPQEDGSYNKIAHVGNVIIEDQVEIGANTSIDRASMGSTIIRKGAKLDNLIQVAHNVEIGAHTVIASQAGVAGSTKIGAHCRIGGQVGFVGHINVADGTQIQAQSGIASEVRKPNTALFGSPAIPYRDYIKSYAVFRKLPTLYKKIFDLEKQLKQVIKQKPN